LPRLSWRHTEAGSKFRVSATSAPAPAAARLWLADAATRDFRKASWKEQSVRLDKGGVLGEGSAPEEGHRGFFVGCGDEQDGLRYFLPTQLRIVAAPKR